MGFVRSVVWTAVAVSVGIALATVEVGGRTPLAARSAAWRAATPASGFATAPTMPSTGPGARWGNADAPASATPTTIAPRSTASSPSAAVTESTEGLPPHPPHPRFDALGGGRGRRWDGRWRCWSTACTLAMAPALARTQKGVRRGSAGSRPTARPSPRWRARRSPRWSPSPPRSIPVAAGEPQKGIGSGFIISPDGYVLTAAHVVEDAESFTVSLLDARGWPEEVPATLVGSDPQTDCALLKVKTDRQAPQPHRWAAPRTWRWRDWVVVIGSPYGLDHSVSVGVVSAKGRTDIIPGSRTSDVEYLQTDAAINPGNSGGPMLESRRQGGGHRQRGEHHRSGHRLRRPGGRRPGGAGGAAKPREGPSRMARTVGGGPDARRWLAPSAGRATAE